MTGRIGAKGGMRIPNQTLLGVHKFGSTRLQTFQLENCIFVNFLQSFSRCCAAVALLPQHMAHVSQFSLALVMMFGPCHAGTTCDACDRKAVEQSSFCIVGFVAVNLLVLHRFLQCFSLSMAHVHSNVLFFSSQATGSKFF